MTLKFEIVENQSKQMVPHIGFEKEKSRLSVTFWKLPRIVGNLATALVNCLFWAKTQTEKTNETHILEENPKKLYARSWL
ncbi:MAG: hypothetical protein IJU64_03270 [Bacilli bacterium]|nr:hypothetical protein [Bacilli bacterium]